MIFVFGNRTKLHFDELKSLFSTRGGGYFPVKDYCGCAAGWGRIFATGLTIMELHF